MNNMANEQSMQDTDDLPRLYLNNQWRLVPIPHGTKGPALRGWNQFENTISDSSQIPADHGIGIAHAYSGTMALDVDEWDRAAEELAKHGISLQGLFDAPDAVTIESGKAGHGKLLYAMPFGSALTSKKLIDSAPDGSKYNYLDFRCATANGLTVQDVLPPSIHPETCQPYRWGGKGHWSKLPIIPADLLSFWQNLIEQDKQRVISDGAGVDASWDDIRSALEHISPDLNRDQWVSVGMALQWAGTQTDQEEAAFHLWDEWSAGSVKYKGQKDTVVCWRSFTPDGGTTLGTLFHIAREHGWKRPMPSAEELFSDIQVTDKSEAAPEFDILAGLRPPAPDMDMSLWPTILTTRANEISDGVGCDPLVPLFAGLAVVCGAIDSRIRLELVPGYRVPPLLWLMTIGDPADKKSPGSRPMATVLKEIEAEDRPRHKEEMQRWEAQEAAYSSAHKAFLDYYSAPETHLENDVAPALPELPPQPVPLKITVQDITSQKLVRHAAERPRGLLCWLDEMAAWVKKVTDPRSGEDRSAWVQAYESETYEMDRVGAGSIWCENLAISIYGNIQPKVFRQNITNMAADGMVQRFLPAILRPGMTRLGNPIPDAFSSKPQWDQLIRTIHALPDRVYTLSQGAYAEFRGFQQWYETTKNEERLLQAHDTYMTAFGKLEGQCGRLALVLHAIENPYEQEVSEDLMKRVIELVKGYVIPALRYAFGEVGGLTDDTLDSWMASHILHHASISEELTLRDLKHSARRRLADITPFQKDQMVIEAMTTMESCNWVALVESDTRRNHWVWRINPQLASTFKEQREKVIRIKQARMDDNWKKTGYKSERRVIADYDPDTMDD